LTNSNYKSAPRAR